MLPTDLATGSVQKIAKPGFILSLCPDSKPRAFTASLYSLTVPYTPFSRCYMHEQTSCSLSPSYLCLTSSFLFFPYITAPSIFHYYVFMCYLATQRMARSTRQSYKGLANTYLDFKPFHQTAISCSNVSHNTAHLGLSQRRQHQHTNISETLLMQKQRKATERHNLHKKSSKAPHCNLRDTTKLKAYVTTHNDPLPMTLQKTGAATTEFHYRPSRGRFDTSVLQNRLCKSQLLKGLRLT